MTTPDPRTAPRAAAVAYRARGWAPLPLPRPGKRPQLADWPAFTLTDEALDAHFPPGRDVNLGLLLGDRSGGLVDVDLDCPEAVAAAPVLLPPTGMTTGRAGGPSHYWYVVPDPPRKAAENFDDPTRADDARHLLELRSTGGQTVVPPSVYPPDPARGRPAEEACVFHRAGDPPRVARPDLAAAVRATAAAALLARHWPTGARNRLAQAVAGGLLRAGWAVDRAQTFLRAVAVAARDEEVENRVRTVGYTADRLARNEPAIGWPVAETILGAHGAVLVSQIREWLGIRVAGGAKTPPGKPGAPPSRYTPLPPWRPFPVDHLPGVVRAFTAAVAAAMRCDPTYVCLPALAACAGMIGTTRIIALKTSWTEPAMLWTATVGDSGTLKTPPYKAAVAPVIALQKQHVRAYKEAARQHAADLREYERDKRRNKDQDPGDPPAPPACTRVYARDVTVEALAGILNDNRNRLLIGRDELNGWLASFNQYKAKGGSDQANWLELHHRGTLDVSRKTGDTRHVFIEGVGVSVCGGIQPGVLRDALSPQQFRAGLPARLLFAYPPRQPKEWTEEDVDPDVEVAYARLLTALAALEPHTDDDGEPYPVKLRLAPDAKAAWVAFYNRFGARQAETEGDTAAAFSKLEGYAARLALVHHVCQSVSAGEQALDPVPVASITAGIGMAEWFCSEAERIYQMLGEETAETETRKLVETVGRLAARHGGRITTKLLQRSNQRTYRSAELAELALEQLVQRGLGRWEDLSTGGRPSRVFVPCVTCDESDESPADDCRDDDPPPCDDSGNGVTNPPTGPAGPDAGSDVTTGISGGSTPRGDGLSSLSSHVTHETDRDDNTPGEAPGAEERSSHTTYTLVTSPEWIGTIVSAVEDSPSVALDTETTGLDPRTDRVRLLQLGTDKGTFVLDLFRLPPTDLGPLFDALAAVEVVGHNLQFDLRFLARYGFTPGRVFDTMLASQVLRAGERDGANARLSHKLGAVAARELGRDLDKTHQTADWSKVLTPAMLAYAAADVDVLRPLADALRAELDAAQLTPTAELEMRALPGVAAAAPVGVDVAAWAALARTAKEDVSRLEEQMSEVAPNGSDLFGSRNWNSPQQVAAAFASVGVTLGSTADGVLAQVDHPLAALLRAYRGATKRVGTYGRTWVRKHAPDGVVATSWNQMGAASGRMSSSAPNLQQIPRGSDYRRCFTARPGHLLVKADYSQIELRIAAKVANDEVMIAAYRDGRDLHRLTAAQVLGKPEAELTKNDRQVAKSLNFGLLYGMGWKSLRAYARASYGVTLTDAQARSYRDAFFRTYPGLWAWHRREQDRVDRLFRADPTGTHEARTLTGRRRVLAVSKRRGDGTLYPNLTEALNTPVQGTGADGLKAAIARVWETRAVCPAAVPVLFCHDEIVLDVPEADAGPAADWLRRCMVEALAGLLDPIPVEVEVSVGRTWGG